MGDEAPFRYWDQARSLGESLRDIEVALPPEPTYDYGGLDRIASGQTALSKMASDTPPNPHAEVKKLELKNKLKTLLTEKKRRELGVQHKVASFIYMAKFANPTGPEVTPSAMTSGDGDQELTEKGQRDRQGAHQGPAANFFANGLKELRKEEQAKKTAARIDKEVAKGNVSYADADPRISRALAPEKQQEVSRIMAMDAAPVDQKTLNRRRDLRVAKRRNTLATAEKHRQAGLGRVDHPDQSLNNLAEVVNKPNQPPGYKQLMEINAPDTAGQMGRTARRVEGRGKTWTRKTPLVARKPIDSTLNHSVLEHELGEREALIEGLRGNQPIQQHSGHLGIRAKTRENVALQGDPAAVRQTHWMRMSDPDDVKAFKAMRQAGDHPDFPIQPNTRRERAAQKIFGGVQHTLEPRTQRMAAENAAHYKQFFPKANFGQVIKKLAASRLDKEVKAGRMTYAQAYPGYVPRSYEQEGGAKGLKESKRIAREVESEASAVAPQALARRRALNNAVYQNKMRLGGEGNTTLVNAHVPGAGPMNMGVPGVQQNIAFVPETSGQWFRAHAAGDRSAANRATWGLTGGLPAREAIDGTLNRMALEHELGEGVARNANVVHPHATHMGAQPLLRENLALHGDPEAQRLVGQLRNRGMDDIIMQKAMKQVGAHPDRPLAMDGRQQAAVERILASKRDKLSPKTQGVNAGHQAINSMFGIPQRVATVPDVLGQQAIQVGEQTRALHKPLMRPGSLMQRARGFLSNYKNYRNSNEAFGNTLKALVK